MTAFPSSCTSAPNRARSAGDGARCTRQFVARRNRWPAGVQDNLRKMYDKVIEADRLTVALQPAEAGTAGR